MKFLIPNIKYLLDSDESKRSDFLSQFAIDRLEDLPLGRLEEAAALLGVDSFALCFHPQDRNVMEGKKIRLLILDVDGVMTDGGLYIAEDGSSSKRFNVKDGMAIGKLTSGGFQVGIISGSRKQEAVRERARMLGIQNCYVGQRQKLDVLQEFCTQLDIDLSQVAMIGDDVNDLKILSHVGLSACPADAVPRIKQTVQLVLSSKGGQGCIREFIDYYLLDEPV